MLTGGSSLSSTPLPKIIGIGVLIVAAIIILGRLDNRRRRARRKHKNSAVQHYAQQHGYTFADVDAGVDPGWSVWPFQDAQIIPGSISHRNVITGTSGGREFVTYEYVRIVRTGIARDHTSAGAGTSFWRTSVVAVRTPAAWSPKMSLVGHSGAGALLNVATGGKVLDYFQSAKTGDHRFDLRFEVRTEDAGFSQRLLNDRVRQALLSTHVSQRQNAFSAGSGYQIALDLGWLLVIDGAEDVDTRLREGLAVIAAVLDNADPAVWPQQQTGAPGGAQ